MHILKKKKDKENIMALLNKRRQLEEERNRWTLLSYEKFNLSKIPEKMH